MTEQGPTPESDDIAKCKALVDNRKEILRIVVRENPMETKEVMGSQLVLDNKTKTHKRVGRISQEITKEGLVERKKDLDYQVDLILENTNNPITMSEKGPKPEAVQFYGRIGDLVKEGVPQQQAYDIVVEEVAKKTREQLKSLKTQETDEHLLAGRIISPEGAKRMLELLEECIETCTKEGLVAPAKAFESMNERDFTDNIV